MVGYPFVLTVEILSAMLGVEVTERGERDCISCHWRISGWSRDCFGVDHAIACDCRESRSVAFCDCCHSVDCSCLIAVAAHSGWTRAG